MPIDDLTALSQIMRKARKEKDLTQQELSDLGKLLDSHLIKGILSSLVEQNFFLMFLPEFLREIGRAHV